jgi:hypothetical protein
MAKDTSILRFAKRAARWLNRWSEWETQNGHSAEPAGIDWAQRAATEPLAKFGANVSLGYCRFELCFDRTSPIVMLDNLLGNAV